MWLVDQVKIWSPCPKEWIPKEDGDFEGPIWRKRKKWFHWEGKLEAKGERIKKGSIGSWRAREINFPLW